MLTTKMFWFMGYKLICSFHNPAIPFLSLKVGQQLSFPCKMGSFAGHMALPIEYVCIYCQTFDYTYFQS